MNHRALLGHLESWAMRHKLKKSDFIITGIDACILHDIYPEDSTGLIVYVKRKIFQKIVPASDFDGTVFEMNDRVRIIRDDDVRDTVIINGWKTLSLNQIVKELTGINEYIGIVNLAKDKIESGTSVSFNQPITNGVDGRREYMKRIRKQKKYFNRNAHSAYRKH